MKKAIALLLCATLVVGTLTACGGGTAQPEGTETTEAVEETTEEAEVVEEEVETEETAEVAGDAAKTGLAVITSIGKSAPAGEEDGLAQVDSTVAAVLVGADGTILDCSIDAAQTKINFSAEGKVITDLATTFASKQDLGADYGMAVASAIGKEWNEQANAFAEYVIGKTIDEVKGIALSEGVPTDADLTSSVTVHVTDFIAVIEKAVANAKELGAGSTDKLGLAVTTEISKSKDAAADAEGLAQAYSTYAAVTTDADGKVTSSYIDASQGNVNFDATGAITSDLASAPATKQELGEGYGMKAASTIGKEWNEQADAFSAYVVGKTASEVSGIAIDDQGLAADADLISSVTVHVGPFVSIVEKAAANAK